MYTDVRSLAAVGKEKTRIGVSKPTDLNRTTTESSNIGKQSFNTCEGEEYTSKAPPSFILVSYQVVERIERVESLQDRMIVPRTISQGGTTMQQEYLLGQVVYTESSVQGQP